MMLCIIGAACYLMMCVCFDSMLCDVMWSALTPWALSCYVLRFDAARVLLSYFLYAMDCSMLCCSMMRSFRHPIVVRSYVFMLYILNARPRVMPCMFWMLCVV